MFRLISRFVFWINGWKVDDALLKQNNFKKFILCGGPHTSNWDAIIFIAAIYHMKFNVRFLIKQEWMKFPFNIIFSPLGALGIDRSKNNSTVDTMTNLFNNHEELILTITPEGTRKYNPHWKKGFYYIALNSKVPILLGYMDYKNKIAGISKVINPSGNINEDLIVISDFYSQYQGKNPALFAPYQSI